MAKVKTNSKRIVRRERVNTCDVFFCGGGKKKLDLLFFAEKAIDACWEVVMVSLTSSMIEL
jgi:hypothetical protein